MNRFHRAPLLSLALVLSLAGSAFAAAPDSIPLPTERPHFKIPRATSAITIDGRPDEEAWSHALAIPLTVEVDPGKNVPAPVAGTAYLLYDEGHLYAAFRCEDPAPKAIRAHLADRDTPFRDDFVGLMLDTFNDERRGYEFFVNPLGVQMDLAMSEASDNREDETWDAIWQSAGHIGETGYTVEMAIPYNSLRFQRADGEQTWGVLAFRSYPRSLRHQIAATPIDPDNPCLLCQLPKVTGFAGATPGRNLELDPTATAHRTDLRPDDGSRALQGGDVESDLGLTARWGVTPNLILSGALNPDFSQVEADAAQLDVNTDFALFYPEKRPFFLEGADFFATPFPAVYTRTVADPTWGAKLTGKEGKNGLGVFVAQDDKTNLLLPGSQSSGFDTLDGGSTDAALRYRRDLGKSSMLGGLATHRRGEDGYANDVFGVDGLFRPSISDRITFQALGSRSELGGDSFDGSAYRLSYDHNSRNWNWYARRDALSRGFRADLGFVPRVGYSFDLAGLEHVWWPQKKGSWYTSFSVGSDWDLTRDANDTVLEEEWEAWVNLSGPLQSFYRLDGGTRNRFWDGVTYDQKFLNVYTEMRPTGALYLELGGTFGDAIDFVHSRAARQVRLDPVVSYDFGKRLRVGVNHHYQKLTVAGGRLFTANLTELRTVYQINLRTFVRAILQYEDVDRTRLYTAGAGAGESKDLFSQLLFAYKLNPQTVLFLGYNDDAVNDLVPGELTRKDRTLFLKVGYALVL